MIGRFGISYKVDPTTGLIAYSTRSGLFYAVAPDFAREAAKWLGGTNLFVDPRIGDVLEGAQAGAGEAKAIRHGPLLPTPSEWLSVATPEEPLTINWLLTGSCALRCIYCYAEDLMRGVVPEPTHEVIRDVAHHILSFNPVLVVLTGGDPLVSPHLELAISLLHGHCAVVVDTSGLGVSADHLRLFREYDVAMRVSLDSEVPAISRRLRPTGGGTDSSAGAVSAICAGIECGVTVAVQTVATRWNTPDLAYLGDKLCRMGVRLWRVFEVAPSQGRMEGYLKAAGPVVGRQRKIEGMWSHFVEDILAVRARQWADTMAVQLTPSAARNSVVLVAPDGKFYTESTIRAEKIVIDEGSPKRPSREALHAHVDMAGHLRRYVGSRPGEDTNDFQ